MAESVFQTLLLLAYFDIALLSITIANYALSASYLGRESRLSRWRMERRKAKLLKRLKELHDTGQIETITNEIKEADAEKRKLRTHIFLLSWLGAVIIPLIFFGISLTFAVIGMNSEILSASLEIQQSLQRQLTIFSVGTLGFGFIVLLTVIRSIDSAATKIPMPEFETRFENETHEIKVKRNQRTSLKISIWNKGEDMGENLEVLLLFPPTFTIHKSPLYSIHEQPSGADYPNYHAVCLEVAVLHIDKVFFAKIDLTPPDEKKTYEIPVDINERKIGESERKLTVEVMD